MYTELHCHSNFSFLDGASHPEELIARAVKLGYAALAITDHNGLYGVARFHEAAKTAGIKPIIGSEITLDNNHHLVLLARNATGYANLSSLLTRAGLECKKGETVVRHALLEEYTDGLIALSGCVHGEIPAALINNDTAAAERIAASYRDLFGRDNFFLELQHHNLPVHELLCRRLAALGKRLNIGLVATNDVHYAVPDRRRLQDVLACIREHVTLDDAGRLLYPNGERFLKSPERMARLFAGWPDAVANTMQIAERCTFSLDTLETSLPDFPVPGDHDDDSYLRFLTYNGARARWGRVNPTQRRQLEHELALIKRLQLAGYFIIVWDIARFCKQNRILCQGRGSAANSAVCYCLEITAVDPIKLELLFERFLSEQRREPPDIDLDIANNRREEVIQYVYEKYGRQHAAMVCEVITYRGRSAVREVGKALGFIPTEVDRFAKLLGHWSSGEEIVERLTEAKVNVNDSRIRLLVDLCAQIKRFPRHLGIHVGGMIVTKKPLSEVVPIENATMPDRSVIQWDKDDAEATGLVKIDLLGLGMLTMIDLALKLIEQHHGRKIDMAKLPHDDPAVYKLLSSAETVGIFQVESRAQMNTLPRHKPDCFYDLVVEVALIRPGPIQGGMVHPYLRRRNGEEPVTYPHPCLEPVLKRTLGIPLFQEQGMRVAVTAAGFSPSEADELRRAMGHKRSREKMERLSQKLIHGMMQNGIAHDAATRIFDQLAAFADFGFAESHAASFALLVYVSAWLKLYYPAEFYCSLLNAQPMGFYTPSTILYEARRRGMRFKPVDVVKSSWDCTVEGDDVRLGLRYVRSLGEQAEEKIKAALNDGPFVSLLDFVRRTDLTRGNLEQIALVGGFNCFGLTRRQALWVVLSLDHDKDPHLELTTDERGGELLPSMSLPERLMADFKGMALTTGPHPMSLIRDELKRRDILAAAALKHLPDKSLVTTAGVVVIRQRPATASGFLFITLEDETGFSNIVVKPQLYEKFRLVVVQSKALLVKGQLEKADGVINVVGITFEELHFTDPYVTPKSRDFR